MSPEIMTIIQRSLDEIEHTLRAPITAQELADAAGFSLSHFYHVFEAVTGMSVGRYITHRRLLHAAWDMSQGKDAITAALEYGFDTHAGFYKAFRREFGCAPSRFLRSHHAAPPARVNLKEASRMFDTRVIARALSAWGLERETVTPVYYANTGNRSDNTFAVGSRYCIKASDRLGELHRQAALHRILERHGLAAPIVPAADGSEVLHLNGVDFLLTQRLQGTPADAMHLLTHPQAARALGEGLARLHAALLECDPALCTSEDYVATLRSWAIPVAKAALGRDADWMDDFLRRVEETFPSLPTQIIHRDPNPDNILMQDGRGTGFVDFDLSRLMPRLFDLCYAATGVLSVTFPYASQEQRQLFLPMVQAIAAGYDSVSPLSPAEQQALPDMILAIELTCVAAFAGSDKWAHQFSVNRDMLQFLLQCLRNS